MMSLLVVHENTTATLKVVCLFSPAFDGEKHAATRLLNIYQVDFHHGQLRLLPT